MYKIYDAPGLLRAAETYFPYADEVLANDKPGSVGHTALSQILQQPRLAAIFTACAWAYRDATTSTQRHEHLGGMYAIALLLVADWRFPSGPHLPAQLTMQALYEAATGIESQLAEPTEIVEPAVGNLDFFS
ncbi:hypothetical protein [Deinococcus sp. PESE-13]